MKRQVALTFCLAAACMLYAQALGVLPDDVTDKKDLSPGLQNGPTSVRAGFHNISGYYVYINPDTYYSWVQAAQACNILNMALISFETQQKYDTIVAYLWANGLENYNYWTSGHKVEDTFFWTGSGRAFTYTNWRPGEPNEDSSDVCVQFLDIFGWYDDACFWNRNYMCE